MLTDAPPRKTSSARFLPSDRMKTLDPPSGSNLARNCEIDRVGYEIWVDRGCSPTLRRVSGFCFCLYEVPSCSLRVLAARALRVRENWASELFGDDAEFLDAFEASLTNKERREFGLRPASIVKRKTVPQTTTTACPT